MSSKIEDYAVIGDCETAAFLSEEYDTDSKRLIGNFPQALCHIGLINTAYLLTLQAGATTTRAL